MEYLELFSTPMQMNHTNLDIDSLTRFCYDTQRADKDGRDVSNIGGWQSEDLDMVNSTHEEFSKLQTEILSAVNNYHDKIQFKKEFKQKIGNIWININGKGHSNQYHVHSDATLSGVFYLTDSEAPLVFMHPVEYMNVYYWQPKNIDKLNPRNSGQWAIPPKKNTLIVFPAWASHKVAINKEDTDRISISFNTIYTENI
tara:strand:- start:63 stop:659 length:597 start_codon:yes stop_codon:yes gene_type:complete